MGRYYDGDIEGKFWFAVQSSDDGEFFGAKDITELNQVTEDGDDDYHSGYIDYCIDNNNIDSVLEGIRICKGCLGENGKILMDFFQTNTGYNEEMIIKHYKDEHNIKISEDEVLGHLQYVARLQLGIQILIFFNQNPDKDCNFTAEM